jgi:hypothetical protein
MIGDSVNDLCVDDNRIEYDQIRHKNPNLLLFIDDIENRLLPKWDLP